MPSELDSTEKLFEKHSSKPYNPKLANVFFKSGMIEAWGRGFDKIKEACEKYNGRLPEYNISASGIMVLCKACDKYLELLNNKEGMVKKINGNQAYGVCQNTSYREMMNVASYIYNRYLDTKGEKIDEMKLHKMLYFAQRESFIQKNEPLFAEIFYGWKYGSILKEIRIAYRDDAFYSCIDKEIVSRIKDIMDKVFEEYANKDSWSLSRLTHGEIAWKNSRKGVSDGANSDFPIDVIVDYLKQYGLKEDIEGCTAFYIVRNKNNDVLMFFSLKCGELFDPLFDETEIEAGYKEYLLIIQALRNVESNEETKNRALRKLKK